MRKILACVSAMALVSAVGCTESARSGGLSQDELPGALAGAFCSQLQACFPEAVAEAFLSSFAGGECIPALSAQLEQSLIPSLESGILAGTVSYDGAAAQTCVDTLKGLGCEALLAGGLPAVCSDAIAGTVAVGESCVSEEECAGTATCEFAGAACPGTCRARVAAGAACDGNECSHGLVCQSSDQRCGVPLALGEACGDEINAECAANALCVGAGDGATGTCRSYDSLFTEAEGSVCDLEAGTLCLPELSCVLESFAPTTGAEFRCASRVGSGEACKFGFPNQCPSDEFCDVDFAVGSFDGTCLKLPTQGETCAGDPDEGICALGLVCIDDTCVARQALGANCSDDSECISDQCVSGQCASGLCI